jgi:hypothetical protein
MKKVPEKKAAATLRKTRKKGLTACLAHTLRRIDTATREGSMAASTMEDFLVGNDTRIRHPRVTSANRIHPTRGLTIL